MAKDKTYRRLINTRRWLQLRKAVLSSHPLCLRCELAGRLTAATEVHHVRPVEEAYNDHEKEKLMYDPTNLVPLCHRCHVELHTQMGRCGREANKERNRRQVDYLIKKFILNKSDDDEEGG